MGIRRAGRTTTRWSFGDDESQLGDYAWYYENAFDIGLEWSQPVGMKLPNPWGLYDIHGNVYEWVADAYGDYSSGAVTDPSGPANGTGYVGRGGSFSNAAHRLRSANRLGSIPRRYGNMGACLLRTGPQLSGASAVSGRSWG